jgi:hypothetical protein
MRLRAKAQEIVPDTTPPESGIVPAQAYPGAPKELSTLPRLQTGSDRDSSASTLMSELVADLARLSSLYLVPKLVRPIGPDLNLTPAEAYIASLIGRELAVSTIVDVSALEEDETLRCLATLITGGIATIAPRA